MTDRRGTRFLVAGLVVVLVALGLWGMFLQAHRLRERGEARRQVKEALAGEARPLQVEELFRLARSFDVVYAACQEGARLQNQGQFAEAAASFQACLEGDPGLVAAHQAWAEALLRARGRPVYAEVRSHLGQLVEDQRRADPEELEPVRELIADLDDLLSEDSTVEFPREWSEEEILKILTRKNIRGSSRYDEPRVPLWLGFRPEDTRLGRPAEEQLLQVARALKDGLLVNTVIQIEGYADSLEAGSETARKKLATRRAEAVRDFLVRHGVSRQRLRIVGMGGRYPISSNRTEEGRGDNRRVELYNLETKQPLWRDVRKP
jgi:outer membrane protein OmpA-like peptidoglycan-associated protein